MLATKNPARAVFFLVTAAVTFLAGCMASGPRALLDGNDALQEGKPARAIEKLKRATELMPDDPRAWNFLGLAYHQAGQLPAAAESYRKALARDRSNILSVAHFNLGCLLLELGNAPAAIDELRSYTMISNSASAWMKLGEAQLRMRQFDGAERSLVTSLRLDQHSAEAYNNLGLVYLHKNRVRDAHTYLNAALQVNPKHGPAILNLAILSQQTVAGRPAALQRYREYLALQPGPANWQAVKAVAQQLEAELAPRPIPQTNAVVIPDQNALSRTPAVALVTTQQTVEVKPPAPASNPPPPAVVTRPLTNPAPRVVFVPPVPAPEVAPRAAVTAAPPANVVKAPPPQTNSPPPEPVSTAPPSIPVTVVSVAPPPPLRFAAAPVEVTTPPAPRIQAAPPENRTEEAKPAPKAPISSPPPEIAQPLEKPSKPGLLTRLNPFRSKPSTETANSAAKSVPPPQTATRLPSPAVNPAAPPAEFPRYTYANPPAPGKGNRADADRAFASAVKALKAGHTNEALLQYQAAATADPSYMDPQYNLALLTMDTGNLTGSLKLWEAVLAGEPESINARYNFAIALKQSGYLLDAANELERVLVAKPNEARAHLTLGNLYSQQINDKARARTHYMKVLELDPRNSQASAIRFWLAANP